MSEAARVLRSSLTLLPFLTWALPLRAEPVEEAVRFQFTAPPACPDAAAFAAQVRERTSRGRLAEPGELGRTFNVQIAPDVGGFSGEIEFLDDGGGKVNRHLRGEQCDAVVSSLALITALALDATLRQDEEPPAPTPAPPAAKAVPPVASRPVVVPKKEAPRPTRRARSLQSARVGVTAGYGTALHSSRLGLSAELGLLGQLDWNRGLALRLSAHFAARDFMVDEGRRAAVRLLGIETSVCPWRFRWQDVALSPCAAVDLGSLRGEGLLGDKLTAAHADTILWAAAGAELRVAWEPAGPLWAELRGSAAFPLVAGHQFQFSNPPAVAYQVPYVTGLLGLAFGVRFW